jgi:hypothetical protein
MTDLSRAHETLDTRFKKLKEHFRAASGRHPEAWARQLFDWVVSTIDTYEATESRFTPASDGSYESTWEASQKNRNAYEAYDVLRTAESMASIHARLGNPEGPAVSAEFRAAEKDIAALTEVFAALPGREVLRQRALSEAQQDLSVAAGNRPAVKALQKTVSKPLSRRSRTAPRPRKI